MHCLTGLFCIFALQYILMLSDSTRGIYRKKLLRLMSQAVNAEPVVVNGSAEEEDEFSDNDDEEEEEEEEGE